MGLLQQCAELFNTSNLYEVLCVAKEASNTELRHGYYKLSLQVHPDRAPGDQQATNKFQVGLQQCNAFILKLIWEFLFFFLVEKSDFNLSPFLLFVKKLK